MALPLARRATLALLLRRLRPRLRDRRRLRRLLLRHALHGRAALDHAIAAAVLRLVQPLVGHCDDRVAGLAVGREYRDADAPRQRAPRNRSARHTRANALRDFHGT